MANPWIMSTFSTWTSFYAISILQLYGVSHSQITAREIVQILSWDFRSSEQ
jgi:hypothetical protein